MINPNRSSRIKSVTLAGDNEETPAISGDFKPEGFLDHFRKSEILVPTEVDAIALEFDAELYILQFYVGVNPGGDTEVNELEVRTAFSAPVHRLRAWHPTQQFVTGKTSKRTTTLTAKVGTQLLKKLEACVPGFARDLLPQIEFDYEKVVTEEKEDLADVVRTMSDGQRNLVFKLTRNVKTGVDPKQFLGKIVFAVRPKPAESPLQCLDLEIRCRCGAFSLKNQLTQKVSVWF